MNDHDKGDYGTATDEEQDIDEDDGKRTSVNNINNDNPIYQDVHDHEQDVDGGDARLTNWPRTRPQNHTKP